MAAGREAVMGAQSMTPTHVLTLWQPWAQLLVDPDLPKTIETRPRRTNLRGWVLINAAARRPDPWHTLGDYRVDPRTSGWWLTHATGGEGIRRRFLPLGAVVGAVYIDDCLPIVDIDDPDCDETCIVRDLEPAPVGRMGPTAVEHHLWIDHDGSLDLTWLDDQLPYGDFTPGRWAWTTSDRLVLPEPIPWRGAQGWQYATDDLIARVVAQVGPDRFGGPDAG